MAPEIMTLAGTILRNPEKVEITPVSTDRGDDYQCVYHIDKGSKNSLIVHLLEDPKIKNVLVFTRTKHGADKVVKFLVGRGIVAEAIHGNKSQNNRQRALSNFKEQTTRVLVATDIASRESISMPWNIMINYDIPNILKPMCIASVVRGERSEGGCYILLLTMMMFNIFGISRTHLPEDPSR